jgi:nucleotide-binding universal stress UspA family protein
MNSVLVGIDGSEDSRVALRWAAAAADVLGLPLTAMWAWQYPTDAIFSAGRMDLPDPHRADELAETQLQHLVGDVLGDEASHVKLEVARGPAARALLHAAEGGPQMVVVGSRGLGGFKGLLLGSVTRQLCEHAPCPVTVVRRTAAVAPFRLETIVAGVDGSVGAFRALDFAADLATMVDAELVVAHAAGRGGDAHPPELEPHVGVAERRDRFRAWCAPLRERRVDYRPALVEGDARTALLDVARDHTADLLVVGSRGHGPVAELPLGCVASSLVQHSELPVTIVPHTR